MQEPLGKDAKTWNRNSCGRIVQKKRRNVVFHIDVENCVGNVEKKFKCNFIM